MFLLANIVTTSKALVTTSDALVTTREHKEHAEHAVAEAYFVGPSVAEPYRGVFRLFARLLVWLGLLWNEYRLGNGWRWALRMFPLTQQVATTSKCVATSNKGITTSS